MRGRHRDRPRERSCEDDLALFEPGTNARSSTMAFGKGSRNQYRHVLSRPGLRSGAISWGLENVALNNNLKLDPDPGVRLSLAGLAQVDGRLLRLVPRKRTFLRGCGVGGSNDRARATGSGQDQIQEQVSRPSHPSSKSQRI